MDSTKFRKSYARLHDVTFVEANGHTIGVWVPAENGLMLDVQQANIGTHVGFGPDHPTVERDRLGHAVSVVPGFNTRPFTPVPKRHG